MFLLAYNTSLGSNLRLDSCPFGNMSIRRAAVFRSITTAGGGILQCQPCSCRQTTILLDVLVGIVHNNNNTGTASIILINQLHKHAPCRVQQHQTSKPCLDMSTPRLLHPSAQYSSYLNTQNLLSVTLPNLLPHGN